MSKEALIRIPESPITPDSLLKANHTILSRERIRRYEEGRAQGVNTLLLSCADARSGPSILGTDKVAAIRSIAGSFNPKFFQYVLQHAGIGQILIAEHFNGTASADRDEFVGCGGLGARKHMRAHGSAGLGDVSNYVERNIHSSHPIEQGMIMKDNVLAQLTGDGNFKPIMVTALDHVTGLFTAFWSLDKDENGLFQTTAVMHDGAINRSHVISPSNLKAIPDEALSEEFANLLVSNRNFSQDIRNERPDFEDGQKTQDPRAIFVTTSLIPLRNRFSGIFDSPNQVFVVSGPVLKGDDRPYVLEVQMMLHQVSYAVDSANNSNGGSFRHTGTIVFDTPIMDESVRLAREFSDRQNAQVWKDRGGKVIVSEVRSGVMTDADYFDGGK